MHKPDVIVIGAGIIGAACAHALARSGQRVRVIDSGIGGATHAGMGHLVVMDDNAAEMALSQYSVAAWAALAHHMPADCAFHACGTVWVAADAEEMAGAEDKRTRLLQHGLDCSLLTAAQLAAAEPGLRSGLAGGLLVPGDGTVYAPNAARWLLGLLPDHVTVQRGLVTRIDGNTVWLEDGSTLTAPQLLLATGLQAMQLVPGLPVRAKKGHLLITDRYPGALTHQLVELGYITSAHHSEGPSVAFNVQPRPTGQILIGSSRQFDTEDRSVDPAMLARMLQRACFYMPGIADLNAIRSWTGQRPATPDSLPILDRHPANEHLWLAVGHEGLGVTTATGTADILAALMTGAPTPIDSAPYALARFGAEVHAAVAAGAYPAGGPS
ncbi:D-amino-acid oxidase [Rhodoferax lacus]|uniref:D-amino-acid oxidase n=1 Tax=Rhodoferax lacus TaxID=2184758 RepID=A0A3E1RAP1_9BURK|nr:FAD-dependent oxidoreductase [Rhodoferax lacus]RFO96291.1 D-amino-acid oxidase [Rhodoferax lacus]